jgi:thiamine pyrophosphate-dependent acetolactate synthase large subunit-like protein
MQYATYFNALHLILAHMGLGAYAEQVRTPDQVAPAIRRALQANQNGQNAVLEMLTKEEGAVPKYWQGY